MTKILIEAGFVIPEARADAVVSGGAVAIDGDQIVGIGYAEELRSVFSPERTIRVPGSAVLPGLVNTHTHLVGGFNKAITEDISGPGGLFGRARPLQEKFVKAENIYYPGFVHGMEMLMTGTTTINETWWNQSESARIVRDLGIRAVLAEMVREADVARTSPTNLERNWNRSLAEHGFEKAEELIAKWHGFDNGRITCRIGPHAADMLSEWGLLRCKQMAEQYAMGIHMHLAQVPGETEYVLANTGKRPVSYLNELGILGPDTMGIHCVFLNDDDIEIMASTGTSMSHTAYLVAKRAYFPPMPKIYGSKMLVSLGSDWCANDMWKIMRTAILFGRVLSGRVDILSAYDALRMATIDGARALGLADQIGTLAVGKKADIIVVDMQKAWCQPIRDADVITNLVYNANGSDVTHVLVDGKILVEESSLRSADQHEMFREAQSQANLVWGAASELFD